MRINFAESRISRQPDLSFGCMVPPFFSFLISPFQNNRFIHLVVVPKSIDWSFSCAAVQELIKSFFVAGSLIGRRRPPFFSSLEVDYQCFFVQIHVPLVPDWIGLIDFLWRSQLNKQSQSLKQTNLFNTFDLFVHLFHLSFGDTKATIPHSSGVQEE